MLVWVTAENSLTCKKIQAHHYYTSSSMQILHIPEPRRMKIDLAIMSLCCGLDSIDSTSRGRPLRNHSFACCRHIFTDYQIATRFISTNFARSFGVQHTTRNMNSNRPTDFVRTQFPWPIRHSTRDGRHREGLERRVEDSAIEARVHPDRSEVDH